MADGKNKILFYRTWAELFKKLSVEEAGRLIIHFSMYITDENPSAPDRITELLFEEIKSTLKRDLVKWEDKKETTSISGRIGNIKRYHPDVYTQILSNEIDVFKAEEIIKSRKCDNSLANATIISQNLAVTVTDTVTVNKYNMLSEVSHSDISQNKYLEITVKFWNLFKANKNRLGVKSTTLDKATTKWVDSIRLMIESDKRSIEDLGVIYKFLKEDDINKKFSWAKNIFSTDKLREKFEQIIIVAKENEKPKSNRTEY